MHSSNSGRVMIIALIAVMLGACGSDGRDGVDGAAGRNGTNGNNGTNGSNGTDGASALVNISPEPAGANCADGGHRIDFGQDTNGNGVLDAGEVTGSRYTCNGSPEVTYTIGGTITGLTGTLVLQNNANGYLAVSAAGSFTFGTPVSVGSAYAVTVLTQPRGQTCIVTNGSGSALANVTSVQVNCTPTPLINLVFTPAGGNDVDRMAAPSMTFLTALDPATVIPANVTLSSSAGDQPLTLQVFGTRLVATPTRQLLPATLYRVVARDALRGNAGERLVGNITWTFTTRDGQWQPPALLETASAILRDPQIAVDANGNAMALWSQQDGAFFNVWANRYTRGNGWGVATLVETNDSSHALLPQLAVDASGNALAVWSQFDGTRDNIWANRYTVGSGWGLPLRIENDPGHAQRPNIAMDASGNALAVWTQSDGTRANVWANRYTPVGGWDTPTLIETDDAASADPFPQIAVDAGGNGLAVWTQSDGARSNVWSNRYTAGSGWGAATLIETNDAGLADAPQIAVDANGNGFAVWIQADGARFDVWANRYTAGSGWDAAALIETNDSGTASGRPQIAMNANGNALAVWSQSTSGPRSDIWSNRYAPGGGWSGPALIEDNNQGIAINPQIVVDASGNALAVWAQSDGSFVSMWSNRYIAGANAWGTAGPVTTNTTDSTPPPDIAIDPSGNALAVWPQFGGTHYDIVASRFE